MTSDAAVAIKKRPRCQMLTERQRKNQLLLVDAFVSPRYRTNIPAIREEEAPRR